MPVAVEPIAPNELLSIYPNPTEGVFVLNGVIDYNSIIFIYDSLGKLIYHNTLDIDNKQIDSSAFGHSGVYHVMIHGRSGIPSVRLMVF